MVGDAISPLAQRGLDEAFGLAVGVRAIGTSEGMLEAALLAGGSEALGAERRVPKTVSCETVIIFAALL